ncbi:MAG: hypothetical protein HDR18_16540 [Lachnospiraceae bacterium]|nr:hypothetical protein [Lachnospiraceae bacterium]
MEEKNIWNDKTAEEKSHEMDVYSLIRSAEIRDYYRRENVCDNWEKKAILILHGYISVQQKAAMLKQLSETGTVEEKRLSEEICLIYSRYTDMVYHPSVRTLFVMESVDWQWNDGSAGWFGGDSSLDSVYESLDEIIARMEEVYAKWGRETVIARVTVVNVPPDEKAKEVFKFYLFWIDGEWVIKEFHIDDNELRRQGISDESIKLMDYTGGWQYHPLPFENGCRLKFQLPFMDEPVYGTLESELDGNGCWYHFLYLDDVDGKGYSDSLGLTDAEINLTSGYSSLDWIERA